MGGTHVLAMLFLAERLGAAVFTGLTVTAAIVTSVLLDHYGWLGFARQACGASWAPSSWSAAWRSSPPY